MHHGSQDGEGQDEEEEEAAKKGSAITVEQ